MAPGTRRTIGAFLKGRRENGGWSVAEVAERAGVGASWYGWLESGRNLALSHVVLSWVSGALELTREQRARLLRLAEVDVRPELSRVRAEIVPLGAREILSGFPEFPAYITGRRGDVLAWNEPTEALYRCSTIPATRRNTLLFLFDQPDVRRLVVNWEEQAQRVVGAYRERAQTDPSDAWLDEVGTLLSRTSGEFRLLWDRSAGRSPEEPFVKVFHKRAIGRLTFRVEELAPREAPDLTVTVYVPDARDGTSKRLAALLKRHRRPGRAREEREKRHRIARQIKDHLDLTYMDEVPAEQLSSLFGLDRFSLSRTFAEDVGFPPHAYRLLVRVERAKRLLLRGDAAVDVAAAVGFVDQSHLIRHFRRIEGVTPGEFVRRASRART